MCAKALWTGEDRTGVPARCRGSISLPHPETLNGLRTQVSPRPRGKNSIVRAGCPHHSGRDARAACEGATRLYFLAAFLTLLVGGDPYAAAERLTFLPRTSGGSGQARQASPSL